MKQGILGFGISTMRDNGCTGSGATELPKSRLHKIVTATRIIMNGPLRCRKLAYSLVTDRAGIEIGGPSAVFSKPWYLPIYDKVRSLDNCDFQRDTTWASHEDSYLFDKCKPPGRTYFCEGSNLEDIPDNRYDFVLSSHNLEHMANPIKALREWQRVMKPAGHLILVLPYYRWTFDRARTPTPVEHMLEDYDRRIGEDDLTHVEEICTSRLDKPSGSDAESRNLLMNNFSHRMIHHHVFEPGNSRQLLEASGLKVLAVELYPPIHAFLIAQSGCS
jgi:SAM-dependent methyltransferase